MSFQFHNFNTHWNNDLSSHPIIQNWFECKRTLFIPKACNWMVITLERCIFYIPCLRMTFMSKYSSSKRSHHSFLSLLLWRKQISRRVLRLSFISFLKIKFKLKPKRKQIFNFVDLIVYRILKDRDNWVKNEI
jgi:hypothetical protein